MPEVQAAEFELLTVALTDSSPDVRERLQTSWVALMANHFPGETTLASQLYEVLEFQNRAVADALRERFPEAFERLRDEAQHRRIFRVLESIASKLGASGFDAPDQQSLVDFAERYRRQLRVAHKNITPPDFDRRRDVAIEDLYVSPTITRSKQSNELVASLYDEVDRTVLLGDPGNGKSTASQVLIYEVAQQATGPIPLLVVLREFAGERIEHSILQYIETRLARVYQCEPPAGAVEHLLETGQAIVVFDGLDELLETSRRREVTDVVELFCNRYPLARVLVTSRRVGYVQAPMDQNQFDVLELNGFGRDQVDDYVRRWFSQEDLSSDDVDIWTESFMKESESVQDLTSTPLLLALMCIIYRGERSLPKNRPAVYERCATMLFDKWDSSRGINTDLRAGQLVDPAMKHLAYWIFSQDNADGVTESGLIAETTRYLHERSIEDPDEAVHAAKEFVEFCRGRAWVFTDVGTTPDGEPLYKFTHRTFLEYFAAYHLSRIMDTPELLAETIEPRIGAAEWDVVAQLAVQIADKHKDLGANRIFEHLLGNVPEHDPQFSSNVLAFLARCLTFVQVSPATLRSLTRLSAHRLFNQELEQYEFDRTPPALLTVMTNSQFVDHETVQDELLDVLDSTLQGNDEAHVSVALMLITKGPLLPYALQASHQGPHGELWASALEACADKHKDFFVARNGVDMDASIYCVRRAWVGVYEFLTAFDNKLNPLFSHTKDLLIGVSFVDVAFEALACLVKRSSTQVGTHGLSVLEILNGLARFIEELPEEATPWCEAELAEFPWHHDTPADAPLQIDLDERQLLTGGLLLLTAIESDVEDWSETDVSTLRLGTLDVFCPIILQRIKPDLVADMSQFEPGPLTDLIRRWAEREISFTNRENIPLFA
jgi:hypothetical protein